MCFSELFLDTVRTCSIRDMVVHTYTIDWPAYSLWSIFLPSTATFDFFSLLHLALTAATWAARWVVDGVTFSRPFFFQPPILCLNHFWWCLALWILLQQVTTYVWCEITVDFSTQQARSNSKNFTPKSLRYYSVVYEPSAFSAKVPKVTVVYYSSNYPLYTCR